MSIIEYNIYTQERSGCMKMEIRGRNIDITDALKEYTTKRLSKLEKYIEDARTAQVALSVEGERHKVEVTIPLNGVILRGEVASDDMYSAIDLVEEKLEKQIEKHKTKLYKSYRGSGLKQAVADEIQKELENKDTTEKFQIVRTKRFALKPMDEEEAIMQMNLLGHSFFVFMNAETEEVNVVYKRKDKHYGLIEPDFD
jgi:putative sigma-54 modulation protein